MDGNKAAAYVSYAFTEVAAIFPITPSSPMAENSDEWAAQGLKNIFGRTVKVVEMQSEAGAAGAVHGSLSAGSLTTTYTASQGLLLMIPNMYKIAGELLPGVIHVSARSLATHALNIFGDHSDVLACANTGFAMLATNSVQEVMDLGGIAHLAAIKSRIPFLHFFDGFRTSHEQQKIEVIDYDDFAKMLDYEALQQFRDNALNSDHPVVRGTNQNPDIFFQAREAASPFFDKVPDIVHDYMAQISALTGRHYDLFNYHGAPDATDVIIAMGSVCDTAEEVVNHLNAEGRKAGLLKVHLYRPFARDYFRKALPQTVRRIAVLDRVKTPGAPAEPLYMDVMSAFFGEGDAPLIIGGRYGLGSKDTVPADIKAAFDNLAQETPKNGFTLAINDDVSGTSLPRGQVLDTLPQGTIQCKFWGLGSDGTVGANKQAVDIIGAYTDLYAQAYFDYDSKKSGGRTLSHLRFGKEVIKAPYLINQADFISCSNEAYIHTYDLLDGLKQGGIFLLNTTMYQNELAEKMPNSMKRALAEKQAKFYIINAVDIAKDLGLGNRTNMVMQAAFFKLTGVIPEETAVKALFESIEHAYGKKGEKIVNMNKEAVKAGMESICQVFVPEEWRNLPEEAARHNGEPDFVKEIMRPMAANQGDKLPVSAFLGREDGSFPSAGSKYEKRGVAAFVPEWIPENCIQCNQCSYVCPHASIRPVLVNAEEAAQAPEGFRTLKAVGKDFDGLTFRIQVSPMDCQGCGSCVVVCPAKQKALKMETFASQEKEAALFDFAMSLPEKRDLPAPTNVKNSQFKRPLFEFSGACAGCGETPYAKLMTQLYGDRMMIANATGCSSIWGAAVPAMPYCVNDKGRGPAWSNSLFEDCAEFGFGMFLGGTEQRAQLKAAAETLVHHYEGSSELDQALITALKEWLEVQDDGEASKRAYEKLQPLLEASKNPAFAPLLEKKDHFIKKSFWAFGGDGWAYDIGYGGLDHVLASGENVNIFVFDTEVYSNTGGQSSKATPTAAIAKFAASGKRTKKKDLGMMAMSYGYVYVAQIAMGADMNQTLKAIKEAEAYPGPSLIIAYSTCINHGVKAGMNNAMTEMKNAVECGYWQLYRFDPRLKDQGQNPFQLDSKEPDFGKFHDYLLGEIRYNSLARQFPDQAEALFAKTQKDAEERYASYRRLAGK